MKRIKVLQVVGSLTCGGITTAVLNINNNINHKRFEIHYLVYGENVFEVEKEICKLGGKVIHIKPISKNPVAYKKNLLEVFHLYGPYDVVHSHLLFHNGIVLKYAERAGVSIRISHSHNTGNDGEGTKLKKILLRGYYLYCKKLILTHATNLLACGKEAGYFLYGKKIFDKLGYVHNNGIDTEQFAYDKEKSNRVKKIYNLEGKIVFGNIGRFSHIKNQDFLIDIFYEISRQRDDAYFLLIGDGTSRREIEQKVAKYGLTDKVFFLGNISNVFDMLQAIDCIIMPSLFEGLPYVLIEAQACGIKCIISDTITKEVDITGLIKYVSLSNASDVWAKVALSNINYCRENTSEQIKNAGYDIRDSVKRLEAIYTLHKGCGD